MPGSRTAVNLSGIDLDQVHRGSVVTHPGDYRPSRRLDVRFRLLRDARLPLEHNTEAKLFLGAAEIVARVRLLGSELLQPGEEGWLQLELEQPVIAIRGDRYILRRPSPGETLGGGVVIDPHPKGRHKRFAQESLSRLEALDRGTPEDVVFQAILSFGVAPWGEVISRSNLEEGIAQQTLGELLTSGQVLALENLPSKPEENLPQPVVPRDGLVTSRGNWEQLTARAIQEVEVYHASYPLRRGMPREELKSRLSLKSSPQVKQSVGARGSTMPKADLPTRLFSAILRRQVSEGALVEAGPLVYRPGHAIRLSPIQQEQADRLLKRFASAPYAPPSVKETQAELGEELYAALVELGELIPMRTGGAAPEVVFRKEDYERMISEVRVLMKTHGTITAAQVRDHFNTSRRYALAFLEHLDATGLTVREGDARRFKGV